jgi:hypothetical protein
MTAKYVHTARLLLARLERLSADSPYAHRASGLRGSLLRYLDLMEVPPQAGASASLIEPKMEDLLACGFEILEKAAREIRPPRR